MVRPAGTADLDFEVSYDEGGTWTAVAVLRLGDRAWTVLAHRRGAESVSVRSTVADTAGDTAMVNAVKAWNLR
ncbi:hypothetical protein AB0I28_02465 [Phytomonospora sp. NPDC050363]|uniref:hypothetical protein n=1 Tax=Phytomonospora sp. NPDC050363 TaxID=3155642 RepID=UPI00341059CB